VEVLVSRAVFRPWAGYRTFSRKSAAYVASAALAAPLVLTGAARATAAEPSPYTVTPLTSPVDVVGAPKATLKVISPKTERVRNSGDAADRLVLFAAFYETSPRTAARPW
jgi:hypothetical protein